MPQQPQSDGSLFSPEDRANILASIRRQQPDADRLAAPKRPPLHVQAQDYGQGGDARSSGQVAMDQAAQVPKGAMDYVKSFSPLRARNGDLSVEIPEAAKSAYGLLRHPLDTAQAAYQPVSTLLQGIHALIDPSQPPPSQDAWEHATRATSSALTGLLSGYGYPGGVNTQPVGGPSGLTDDPFQQPGLVHQPSGPGSGGPQGSAFPYGSSGASPEELALMRTKPGGYTGGPRSGRLTTEWGPPLPPKPAKGLPPGPAGQKLLSGEAIPPGQTRLNPGPASLPGGSDVVEPTADPRLPAKYASTPVGAPSPPAVMGKANLGEPGPIAAHGEQTATPQQIPMGRHPAGTVVEGEKVGGRIRPMTEAEIQQLIQSRGTAGRTAAPVEQPTPPPKPKGKK
jgi:hypothetical protein